MKISNSPVNNSGAPAPLRGTIKMAVVTACAAGIFAASTFANPISVRPLRGNYCSAMAPQGWFVKAENAQRVAFGADLVSGDGMLGVGYSVFGGGTLTGLRGYETPDRAVAMSLGTRLGNLRQLASNVFLAEYGTNVFHGVAFYEVFPAGRGGFMIVLRTATTASRLWRQRAGEATAVARSLHCNVPMVKAAPDPPSLNGQGKRAGGNREDDTYYNQWLEKEYYHNPKTGENVWVSPSTDYHQTGPEGPGYYGVDGNNTIKLDPGYRY
jgi:hypothetical protein